MTLVDLVTMIGDVLTTLDIALSDPRLPSTDPAWHTLYAVRVHLDDQQKQLVALTIQLDDERFTALTEQLEQANAALKTQIADLNRLNDVINTVSKIAALVDRLLTLAAIKEQHWTHLPAFSSTLLKNHPWPVPLATPALVRRLC